MPKFNRQNRKKIDPRYFTDELLEEQEGVLDPAKAPKKPQPGGGVLAPKTGQLRPAALKFCKSAFGSKYPIVNAAIEAVRGDDAIKDWWDYGTYTSIWGQEGGAPTGAVIDKACRNPKAFWGAAVAKGKAVADVYLKRAEALKAAGDMEGHREFSKNAAALLKGELEAVIGAQDTDLAAHARKLAASKKAPARRRRGKLYAKGQTAGKIQGLLLKAFGVMAESKILSEANIRSVLGSRKIDGKIGPTTLKNMLKIQAVADLIKNPAELKDPAKQNQVLQALQKCAKGAFKGPYCKPGGAAAQRAAMRADPGQGAPAGKEESYEDPRFRIEQIAQKMKLAGGSEQDVKKFRASLRKQLRVMTAKMRPAERDAGTKQWLDSIEKQVSRGLPS